LSVEAVRALLAYPFPGNVRELRNTLLRASVRATDPLIREADLALTSRAHESVHCPRKSH
jgi:transcriptional regulator with GAF, ATPase, and Fis domain